MLIECKHCGAPLEVGEGERATKCKYCGTVSRVRSLKTVAQQTPPGWRPPTQWTPPANFAADSAKTLVYHASWAVRQVVRTVVTLAIVAVVLPVVALLVMGYVKQSAGGADVQQALTAARGAIEQAKDQLEVAKRMATGPSLLEEPAVAGVAAGYRGALPGQKIRAQRLVIHPSHSSLIAQDPKRPGKFDVYQYRGGAVSGPEPERLSGLVKSDPEQYLFDFDEIPFEQLSSLVERTVTELGYEGGKASHVIVERNLPFSPQVVIRVYVSGPRDSGRIDYLTSGQVHKAYR